MRRRSAAAIVGLAAASLLLLTACDPLTGLGDEPSDSASGGPTAPTPDPSVEPTSDVLFTIRTSTTDDSGSSVALTMVGHAPQDWDAAGRAGIKDSFISQCAALGGGTVSNAEGVLDEASLDAYGSILMVIDVTSTPASHALAGGIELKLGSPYFYEVVSGDGLSNPYAVTCYAGYQINSTGTVTSITNYESGSPTPDPTQWKTGRYGFAAAYGSSAILSGCDIQLTALAIDSGIATADGWAVAPGTESECAIGYQGE